MMMMKVTLPKRLIPTESFSKLKQIYLHSVEKNVCEMVCEFWWMVCC